MKIIASIASTLIACLRAAAGFACKVASVPFSIVGSWFGGGAAAAAQEQHAAAEGRAAANEREAASERDAAWVEQLEVLKKVAKAIAAGRAPDQEDVVSLSPAVLRYASGLSHTEAQLVASTSVGKLKAHVKGTAKTAGLPPFVPTEGKLGKTAAAAAAAVPVPDARAARAAEIRGALRRGPQPAARARVSA